MEDINPRPKTNLEAFEYWCNDWQGKMVSSLGKTIPVDQIYTCMHCGKLNTDWKWVCDECSDRADMEEVQ